MVKQQIPFVFRGLGVNEKKFLPMAKSVKIGQNLRNVLPFVLPLGKWWYNKWKK